MNTLGRTRLVELDDDELAVRQAARSALERRIELISLAAARTEEAARRNILRDRQRASLQMKPYALGVGARVRVSYLFSSTVRQQVKSAFQKHFLPSYTREIYTITARKLARGSRRIVLYDLKCTEEAEGDQGATLIGTLRVKLPLLLNDVDRRYLQPIFEDSVPTLALRFPDSTPFFRVVQLADEDIGGD